MRQLLAIFFLVVFAFNLGGYYLVFWGLQYHAGRHLVKQAEAEAYATHDEVIFEVPITLPYTVEQQAFTRANGSFEHNGEFYQVIKQKIMGDKLVLACLQNHQQKKLNRAMTDLAKITHHPGGAKQALHILAKLFKEYQSSELHLQHASRSWCVKIGLTGFTTASDPPCTEIAGPPPRVS